MSLRKLALLAVAITGFTGLSAETATAKPFFLWRPFLPGNYDSYPPPDDVYYMDEEEYYQYLKRQRRKQRIIQDYYTQQEPDYGSGEDYVPPRKAKKKIVRQSPNKPAAKPKAIARKKPAAPAAVAAAKPSSKGDTTASISRPAAASASAMSCSKAADIVTGYGFDSVKPGTCTGSTYSFNAVRSGKNYIVKVNPANGELTEVKKL